MICNCKTKKHHPLSSWRIIENRYTPKNYSRICCLRCNRQWLTKKNYKIKTLTQTLF